MASLELDVLLVSRPELLPPIEPEVAAPPPRNGAWLRRDGAPMPDEIRRILDTWHARKGWVVRVEEENDCEGPDYHLDLAVPIGGGAVAQHHRVVGYDSYHWAVGEPESFAWFGRTMREGRPLTLLLSPRLASDPRELAPGAVLPAQQVAVLGLLDAFVRRHGALVWLAE